MKKLILILFTSVLIVFMAEWFFRSPYSAILANISVPSLQFPVNNHFKIKR